MGKFIYLANIIAADVDFYNIEGNRGDSYLPFGFFKVHNSQEEF